MSGAHRKHEAPLTPAARLQLPAMFVVFCACIYLLVTGTDLVISVILWFVGTAMAVDAIVRRRVERGIAVLWAGTETSASWQLVDAYAKHAGWSAGQRHLIAVVGDWVQGLLIALLLAAVAIWIRSSGLSWPPWRLSGRKGT